MNLGLSWQLSSYTGWGLFGIHAVTRMIGSGKAFPVLLSDANVDSELIVDPLQRALLISVLRASEPFRRQLAPGAQLDFDVLVALGDDLQAAAPYAGRARREIGVVFLESSALSKEGRARGESQARLIAGSTWVAEVLRGHGLDRVTTVLQGVDPRLFHPAPRLGLFPGRFVVFSGGKLEYRKGQDIVLAAFRRFHQRHPDALLVAIAAVSACKASLAGLQGASAARVLGAASDAAARPVQDARSRASPASQGRFCGEGRGMSPSTLTLHPHSRPVPPSAAKRSVRVSPLTCNAVAGQPEAAPAEERAPPV